MLASNLRLHPAGAVRRLGIRSFARPARIAARLAIAPPVRHVARG